MKKRITLPCGIGDTLYWVNKFRPTPRIEEYEVIGFEICTDYKLAIFVIIDGNKEFFWITDTIFFDRKKAENKLKELKGDE